MVAPVRLSGLALHAGVATAVTLARRDGRLALANDGRLAEVIAMQVERTDEGVTLSDGGGLRVDLVEHLLAAAAGVGVHRGLVATVEGPEVPLLDGGAHAIARAIASLEIEPSAPSLVVARRGALEVRGARYELCPSDGVRLEVTVDFAHPLVGRQSARWDGDADDFTRRIAGARTFGFVKDAERLRAGGRAAAVDLAAVLVLTDDGVLDGCAAPEPDEAARHKLLDLIGDLACYGGPPRGRITATRPGHGATHEVVRRALADGILARARVLDG